MPSYPFRIVNVFTRDGQSFSGNPLCVFEAAGDLDSVSMQALARQFNLSETTFVLPPLDADAHARIRIFTPHYEMAFAGHPTLGTAHVCRTLGLGGDSLRLQLPVGVVPVQAAANRWSLTAPAATWRELDVATDELAHALGLDQGDIGERPLWVKAGKEQLIVPLTSEDAVRRAAPHDTALLQIRSEDGLSMAYVFAGTAGGGILSRFFFPQGSAILEDPATGSAAANLGAWCIAMNYALPLRWEIAQGETVGRPSLLFLTIDAARQIHVAGDVIELAHGTVTLR